MGLAASQVRFLQMTNRKATIGYQLQHLSLQKASLMRDMKNVSQDYKDALNTKTLKWSNNSGVSYVDMSYKNLMTPSALNQNKPYMITDDNGKVVLDHKYAKYAEIISPDGKPNGNWQKNRISILSQITGLPAEQIDNYGKTSIIVNEANNKSSELKEQGKDLRANEPIEKNTAYDIAKKVGTAYGFDIAKEYKKADYISVGTLGRGGDVIKKMLDDVALNLQNYMTPDDFERYKKASDEYYEEINRMLTSNTKSDIEALKQGVAGIKVNTVSKLSVQVAAVNVKDMLDTILGKYGSDDVNNNQDVYFTRDQRDGSAWKNWETDYKAWEAEYGVTQQTVKDAANQNNQVFTSNEEKIIAFYDELFSVVAERGWVENSQVEDNTYLNNMLQNNKYYLTSVERQSDYEGKQFFEYDTNIASNFNNVFSVNDTRVENAAAAEYETRKSIINEKESRIDTRMRDLQTEQSAINEMMKGVEAVAKKNIETFFGVMA